MEVHRLLGPGFVEDVYEEALCVELALRGIPYARQKVVAIHYKGQCVGEGRLDLFVDDRLVVELKATREITPLDVAKVLSYLKTTGRPLALLLNFHAPTLRDGIRRLIRTAA